MHLSTDFAMDSDLLDRVMDKGIVVEVWDRVGLAWIDLTEMHVTVSVLELFSSGKTPAPQPTYFLKVEPT